MLVNRELVFFQINYLELYLQGNEFERGLFIVYTNEPGKILEFL